MRLLKKLHLDIPKHLKVYLQQTVHCVSKDDFTVGTFISRCKYVIKVKRWYNFVENLYILVCVKASQLTLSLASKFFHLWEVTNSECMVLRTTFASFYCLSCKPFIGDDYRSGVHKSPTCQIIELLRYVSMHHLHLVSVTKTPKKITIRTNVKSFPD